MSAPASDTRHALLVLVGITASASSRASVLQFFAGRTAWPVFVPALPWRRGVRRTACWLERYLAETVRVQERPPLHVLAYIAGAAALRCLARDGRAPALDRVVYVRGPVQELVARAMIARYGRLLACLLGGRTMIDLADGWAALLPLPSAAGEQGVIIEEGVSLRARALGLNRGSPVAESWDAQRLLPGASDVLRVPESHDEVYTSARLLDGALQFFEHGRFPNTPP